METIKPEQEEVIHEKRQNRKIDISLILSILALIIAILQFVITSPFFTDYYYKSSFKIEETYPYLNGSSVSSNFILKNTSKNTVNNIEIGFQMLADDDITIIPNRILQVTYKDNGIPLKDCFLTIEKLIPNETIFILIHSNYDTLMRYNKEFMTGGIQLPNELDTSKSILAEIDSKYLFFPSIILAKHETGFGEVTRMPKEILLNHKRSETSTSE